MLTPEFHEATSRSLERLASGASLAEVLGIVVEAAERECGGSCVVAIGEPDGRLTISSSGEFPDHLFRQIEARAPDERGVLPALGVWWEPVRGKERSLGWFVVLRQEAGEPTEAEQTIASHWAHLCSIAIERKHREDELRDRESEISTVLEAVLDGIVTIDQRGIIETFNRASEKIFGYSAKEVIGKNVSILMAGSDAQHHDEYLRRYLATGHKKIIGIGREVTGRKKDGTLFPIDLGVSEFKVGDVRKFTGMIHDLTERKKLEAELLRSQKLEAIGTLAAGVAHDFNNLLMGIMGCTSIALNKLPEESPARMFLSEAKAAAERGSKLTRQLLAFSRRAPAEVRPISLNEVVAGTEVMLGRFIRESIELRTELSSEPTTIMGDVAQIETILINLVVNARDAMKESGGTIIVRTRGVRRARGVFVYLEVQDDGIGMDAATRQHIFEPFFTTKSPDRGTGLGLSTVYGIVEQHRGFIEVDTELGRGTSIRVYFPKSDQPRHAEAPAAAKSANGVGVVFVVEDDDLVRLTVTNLLRELGYDVREAQSGRRALDALATGAMPDILVTDVVMPDMTGLDLLKEIRARKPGVKVLLMSGYLDAKSIADLQSQNVSFIAKPFSGEALAKKIQELVVLSAAANR